MGRGRALRRNLERDELLRLVQEHEQREVVLRESLQRANRSLRDAHIRAEGLQNQIFLQHQLMIRSPLEFGPRAGAQAAEGALNVPAPGLQPTVHGAQEAVGKKY